MASKSSSKGGKKRKVVEEEKDGGSDVVEAWELMKTRGPLMYKSLAEYLDKADTPEAIIKLGSAIYLKGAENENKFVVPFDFTEGFTITRNKDKEIIGISDAHKKCITGKHLVKVLVYAAMQERGFEEIIMKATDDGKCEVLAIPSLVNVEETTSAANMKDYHSSAYIVYTKKTSHTVYATPKLIVAVLNHDWVTLADVNTLFKSFNSVSQREDMSDFDGTKLDDIMAIKKEIDDQEAKQSRKSFYENLFSVRVREIELAQRVEYFTGSPSYNFANRMEFKLPHTGPTFLKAGNKLINSVELESLEDDDDVLLATNILSHGEYKNIRGNVGKMQVFKDGEHVGGRKNNRWCKMNAKVTMKASMLKTILSAIASANDSDGSPGGSDNRIEDTVQGTNVELN
jgi:hypothetical protein